MVSVSLPATVSRSSRGRTTSWSLLRQCRRHLLCVARQTVEYEFRCVHTAAPLSGGTCQRARDPAAYAAPVIRLVSWNVCHVDRWTILGDYDADLALLQEARRPPSGAVRQVVPDDSDPWVTAGWPKRRWRTAIARLSDRVALDARPTMALEMATHQAHWTASREGTIAAADVHADGQLAFTVASVYAPWERDPRSEHIYADASAHRILSDLSALLYSPRHRVIVAGDWNILFAYGEYGNRYFRDRYKTVFDRAEALGLRFVGPQHPDGRQAIPWPAELPRDSRCVPTFHHSRQTPETATRQLDFVFASLSLVDRVHTRALNKPEAWGPSDHCRILIDVDV